MSSLHPRAVVSLIALVAGCVQAGHAAERHALTLTPAGMPVRLEGATFFDDGRVLTWAWRNSTREALHPRLRVFAFDERGRFAGSLQRCTASPLQPGTRAQGRVELEIEGVTSRHRFVALVEEARSAATVWRVEGGAVEAARRALNAEDAALTVVSRPNAGGDLTCPCDCETAEAAGRDGCRPSGLAGFTCTPAFFPGGCAQAYTCY